MIDLTEPFIPEGEWEMLKELEMILVTTDRKLLASPRVHALG